MGRLRFRLAAVHLGQRWACLALVGLGACIQPAAYPCERDEQCDAGAEGVCHPEAGYCAYADQACQSGLRFESEAPRPLAGACVGDVQVTGTDTDPTTTSSTSTGAAACGGSAEQCCEPDDSCDAGLECVGSGCGCVGLLVAGDVHSCYVRLDGQVHCWGGNDRGELGRSDPQSSFPEPGPVEGLPGGFNVVSAQARQHTCMVSSNGDVYCWGDNTHDQADAEGPGLVVDPPRLVASAGDGRGWTPQLVGLGARHTCISGDGRIACWGNNEGGQLGFSGDGPQEVDTSSLAGTPRALAGGFAHTCVWTDDSGDSHVYCWGSDDNGQLGGGAGDQSGTAPVEVDFGGSEVFGLTASDLHTCALVGPAESGSDPSDDRSVRCWGNNEQGQAVGPNASATLETPTEVLGLGSGPWTLVLASPEHTCVTSDDSTAFCWGSNSAGRVDPLGSGDLRTATEVELRDETGSRPLSTHPGQFHTCTIADDGSVTCWGCGGSGQLGPDLSACETGAGFAAVTPNCE